MRRQGALLLDLMIVDMGVAPQMPRWGDAGCSGGLGHPGYWRTVPSVGS